MKTDVVVVKRTEDAGKLKNIVFLEGKCEGVTVELKLTSSSDSLIDSYEMREKFTLRLDVGEQKKLDS